MLSVKYKDRNGCRDAVITIQAGWDKLWCPLDIKLDTGADMCVMPLTFLRVIKAPYIGKVKVGDYRGGVQLMPLWDVMIRFNGFEMQTRATCTASNSSLIGMNFITNFNVIFLKDQFLITDKDIIIREVDENVEKMVLSEAQRYSG